MYGRSRNLSFKDTKNTSKSNDLYRGFWQQQEDIKKQNDIERASKIGMSELDRYKRDVINKAVQEVKQYERSHGNSGNFLKDMKWGMTKGNSAYIKPFIKYVGPIVSKLGPEGQAVMKSVEGVSGVVDKLN